MKKIVLDTKEELGEKSGSDAAELIRETIREKGQANIILATGASQFGTLQTIINAPDIDWSKVVMFHLDEYVGIDRKSTRLNSSHVAISYAVFCVNKQTIRTWKCWS